MEAERLDAIAIITGAGSGIGAACAREIARRAEGGLILVDESEDALARVADDLEAHNASPERVSMLAIDVTDRARWAQAVEFIRAQYGRIDWAIVNAAVDIAPAAETDLVDWGRSGSADLQGATLTLRTLMPLMRSNLKGGAAVLAASAAALKERGGATLLQFMQTMANEAAGSTVRVNAIAPGGPETPNWAALPWFKELVTREGSERGAFDAIPRLPTPLARYAKDDSITRLITMMLSDESQTTGATLVVDGGYTL
jgi:2-keto-3-deoxy-L-fuconate dehydrogenase